MHTNTHQSFISHTEIKVRTVNPELNTDWVLSIELGNTMVYLNQKEADTLLFQLECAMKDQELTTAVG